MSGSVAVTENDHFTGTGTTLAETANQPFTTTIATFTDTDTVEPVSDLTATIAWGDGTISAGTVTGSAGNFAVSGTHTYASPGPETATVTLSDIGGTATATASTTINVGGGALAGQFVLTSQPEHVLTPTTVATFTDANQTDNVGGFTATINWGDGTTTAGSITGSNGSFSVSGTHAYADEGNESASVTITRTSDNSSITVAGTVAVTENDHFTGTGTILAETATQPFTATIATFTDTDGVEPVSDLTATIAWGDGTTSAGTITGGAGSFSVSGTHTYAGVGPETATVTLSDIGGTATATASTTINVAAPAGQSFTLTTGTDTVAGGLGNDTINAATNTLTSGDNINGGGGTNTLALHGAGTFDLRAPVTLTNVQVITAQEGQPASVVGGSVVQSQVQTVFLRDGDDATVNVSAAVLTPGNTKAPTINITGAHNAAVINLASGNDIVTVGDVRETVHGGSGTDQIFVTSATIGATIDGGSSGHSSLIVGGGGTMVMGSNITDIAAVSLSAASTPYNFTANAISGLVVSDQSTGLDTLTAGGANQTLTGGAAGHETMVGSSAGSDTFKNTAALFNGDTIVGFGAANDVIDLTNLTFTGQTPQFVQNGSSGTLSITDGTHSAAITLFGQFAAAGFQAQSDGASGTDIIYHQPQQQQTLHSPV